MQRRTFDILTIFPNIFESVFSESMIKRAVEKRLVKINIYNLRDFTPDKHRKVDDRPYGGGPGMVMRPEPFFRAVEYIKSKIKNQKSKVILLSPQGKLLTQKLANQLSKYKHLILICGHYEGVDERVRKYLVDEEISIGDYILTGGEIPAMVLVDCLVRLIPGVLGEKESLTFESFQSNLLEYPQYTRPRVYRGLKVPDILLSGDHKRIAEWREKQALKITRQRRPDLLK
jgi:tRNA (guanine37-N1)-methyltransferase